MKKDTYVYPAKLIYEEGEEIAVVFPDFPGCATCAPSEFEALKVAREALGSHVWCMENDGDEIPDPTPLNKIVCESNERTILVDVFMPVIRLAKEYRSVNRTVTLPAWMNAAALERGVNFSQVLQESLKKDFGIT